MSTTSKIAIGISIASGALLAAWLLTGDRGQKTKSFIARRARNLKSTAKVEKRPYDDSEVHYV
jgi:hypothetical protein